MSDFTRRTLRTWSIAQVVYAVVLTALVVIYVPWKTPVANVAVLVYAALHGAGAIGLWQGRLWGWRASLIAGLLGLVAAVGVVAALLASWAYLRAVFGDFGRGASLASLLFASVAIQLLGLFPALQLRALLRREVRNDFRAGAGLPGAVAGLLSVPWLLMCLVHAVYRVDPLPPVSDEGRQQALRALRAAVDGRDLPETPALEGVAVGPRPLQITLWYRGRRPLQVAVGGEDLAEAVREAATRLADNPGIDDDARRNGRLKIDRISDVAPIASRWGPVLALSVNPGLDGLLCCDGDECRTVLPDDLVRRERFGAAPLVPGIREIRLGLHTDAVLSAFDMDCDRLERIRTESWIEHEGRALPVVRGTTPLDDPGPEAWRRAAVAGGDFILRQLRQNGQFHYIYDPIAGSHPRRGSYSLPRHSGTVYSLALLYGITGERRFRRGAERAIEWLGVRIPARCGDADGSCVREGRRAQLGSAALTVVGMLEYQRRTHDEQYAETAQRLVEFLMFMQRDDGDFHHVYDIREREVRADRRMFASEEAALALVMAHEVLDDERALRAAERALDYLTGPKYEGYFLGRFMYGADHWTCIAAEEAWPRLSSRQYLDFCRGYASFIGRIQFQPGDSRNTDFVGHYGFSTLMVPQAPAAAGFTEAIISTAALARHHEEPSETLERQVALALNALARDQIRPSNSWLMRDARAANGGIRRSLVEPEIRIDFTQHAASALIRGSAL